MPPNAITATSARHARDRRNRTVGMSSERSRSPPRRADAPRRTLAAPCPDASAVARRRRRNECGFGGAGGTITYCLRPSQKTTVEMNISTPGMPNATAGPSCCRNIGISSDAKNEPKLMIQ